MGEWRFAPWGMLGLCKVGFVSLDNCVFQLVANVHHSGFGDCG